MTCTRLVILLTLAAAASGCSSMDPRISYKVTGERAPDAPDRDLTLGVKSAAPTSPHFGP